jgi:regulator of extracellular matrix RemA (YlzA/DUF370 family)
MKQRMAGMMDKSTLLPVGSGWIAAKRIMAVGRCSSAPVKRLIQLGIEQDRLIDLSGGKGRNWVYLMDNGLLILGSILIMEENQDEIQ